MRDKLPEIPDWTNEMDAAITICDKEANIVYMNEKSANDFAKYGGYDLIGRSLFDCHIPTSNEKIRDMLQTPRKHSYINRKNDKMKVIHQTPWMNNGQHLGIIEISFELPDNIALP